MWYEDLTIDRRGQFYMGFTLQIHLQYVHMSYRCIIMQYYNDYKCGFECIIYG